MTADSKLNRQLPRYNICETYEFSETAILCSCKEERVISTQRLGPIKVDYASKALHKSSCKIHAAKREEWKTVILFGMRPFVNRTIELIFESSVGAGGSSCSCHIKLYRTVIRDLSPAFQRFESLYRTPIEKCYENFTETMRKWTRIGWGYDQWSCCELSDDSLLASLDSLPENLEGMIRSGKANPTDRDQHGNTLIHVSNQGSLVLFI